MVSDKLVTKPSSPSQAQQVWVATRPNPLSVCRAAQICLSRLTASQLWLGSKSWARHDKYSICWGRFPLPWSLAEWAMKRAACLLSVSMHVCFPGSLVTPSPSLGLSRHFCLRGLCLSSVCPSVCSVLLSFSRSASLHFFKKALLLLLS